MNYGFSLFLFSCVLEVQAAMSPMSDKYASYSSPIKDPIAVKFRILIYTSKAIHMQAWTVP